MRLVSQEGPAISHLRAMVETPAITLTWEDSPSGAPFYVVYRGFKAFSRETMAGAQRLGVVASGIESFTDTPPRGVDWYYLVLAMGPDGRPVQVFTGLETTTEKALKLPAEARQGPEASPAVAGGSGVLLGRGAPLASLVPDFLASGQASLLSQETESRAQPGASAKAAALMMGFRSPPRLALPPLRVLLQESSLDDGASAGGSPLPKLARRLVANEDPRAILVELDALLLREDDPAAAIRERYYRGVALDRLGRYEEALFDLLAARGGYPAETKAWIDFSIDRLGAAAR